MHCPASVPCTRLFCPTLQLPPIFLQLQFVPIILGLRFSVTRYRILLISCRISCAFPAALFPTLMDGSSSWQRRRRKRRRRSSSTVEEEGEQRGKKPAIKCFPHSILSHPILSYPIPSHPIVCFSSLDLPYAGTDRPTSSLGGPRWRVQPCLHGRVHDLLALAIKKRKTLAICFTTPYPTYLLSFPFPSLPYLTYLTHSTFTLPTTSFFPPSLFLARISPLPFSIIIIISCLLPFFTPYGFYLFIFLSFLSFYPFITLPSISSTRLLPIY